MSGRRQAVQSAAAARERAAAQRKRRAAETPRSRLPHSCRRRRLSAALRTERGALRLTLESADALSFAPKALEVVKQARFVVKDMHDHVAVV